MCHIAAVGRKMQTKCDVQCEKRVEGERILIIPSRRCWRCWVRCERHNEHGVIFLVEEI